MLGFVTRPVHMQAALTPDCGFHKGAAHLMLGIATTEPKFPLGVLALDTDFKLT